MAKAVIVVRDRLAQVIEKCGDDACHSLTPDDAELLTAAGVELHVAAAAAAVANGKP